MATVVGGELATKSLKIKTGDGGILQVNFLIFRFSVVISEIINDIGVHDINEIDNWEPIEIDYVSSATMKKVIEWCEHHKLDLPQAFKENGQQESHDISVWDQEFFNVDKHTLFNIIMAANDLCMKEMLDMAYKAAAKMVPGKTPEELRQIFESNFLPEEEEQTPEENS